MATNKNALIRYKHLDILLSDRRHFYDINDLTERVNDMLYNDGFPEVTRRCIEKDIVYLQEAPFNAPIKRFKWNGKNCVAERPVDPTTTHFFDLAVILKGNSQDALVDDDTLFC